MFCLRTLTIFQVMEFDFVPVFIDENTTTTTPVQSRERRDIIFAFDIIEWICKKKFLNG